MFQRLTLPGPAALAIVRLTGPETAAFLDQHIRPLASKIDTPTTEWLVDPTRVYRAAFVDERKQPIDDIVVIVARHGPDWDVRLHLHGAPPIVAMCERFAERAGMEAGIADPAESAWLTANPLLAAAEAIAPRMLTRTGVRWALSVPRRLSDLLRAVIERPDDMELRNALRAAADGAVWAERFATPLRIALVGPPNAGKSTLVNYYAGRAAAIVSPQAGTTRDWIEVPAEITGLPVVWLDTAGVRETDDPLEAAGIEGTLRQVAAADVVVLLEDATAPSEYPLPGIRAPIVRVVNKVDLLAEDVKLSGAVAAISAATGAGVLELDGAIMRAIGVDVKEIDQAAAPSRDIADSLREIADAPRPETVVALASALIAEMR